MKLNIDYRLLESEKIDFFEDILFSWLNKLLTTEYYDYIVCVERKATAVIRLFLDIQKKIKPEISWKKIISSDAIDYLEKNYFLDKKILVFNEMIHRGRSTCEAIEKLLENTEINIRSLESACFAYHEDFTKSKKWRDVWKNIGKIPDEPHHYIFKRINEEEYRTIWNTIIELLRRSGALLLDTEHIETFFKLNIPIDRFIDQLKIIGDPIQYQCDQNKFQLGLTIENPLLFNKEGLSNQLPPNINLQENVPKKIRIVNRGSNIYAILAIWYPSLSSKGIDEYIRSNNLPKYISESIEKCPEKSRNAALFHLVGLIASLALQKSIWISLYPLVNKGQIEPILDSRMYYKGETLGHLKALYPYLKCDDLKKVIEKIILSSTIDRLYYQMLELIKREYKYNNLNESKKNDSSQEFVGKKKESDKITEIKKKKSVQLIDYNLLYRSMKYLYGSIINDEYNDSNSRYIPSSKLLNNDVEDREIEWTWKYIWETGEKLGINESIRSIIMDFSIDNALLKTKHLILKTENNEEDIYYRSYSPDNEYSRKIMEKWSIGG